MALVGHSPWMEELAALLLTDSATGLRIDFPKSGVMGIDLERPMPGRGSCGSSCGRRWRERRTTGPPSPSFQSSFCPKIARFDECPGFTFALGLMWCTALFTAMQASAAPVAISLSLPG